MQDDRLLSADSAQVTIWKFKEEGSELVSDKTIPSPRTLGIIPDSLGNYATIRVDGTILLPDESIISNAAETVGVYLPRRNGRLLITAGGGNKLSLWSGNSLQQQLKADGERIISLATSADGHYLAFGCVSGAVYLVSLDPGTGAMLSSTALASHSSPVRAVEFFGARVASACDSGAVLVSEKNEHSKLVSLHKGRVSALVSRGDVLLSVGFDGTCQLWREKKFPEIFQLGSPGLYAALSDSRAAVATADGKILFLEISSSAEKMDDFEMTLMAEIIPAQEEEEEMDETAKLLYGDF